MANRSPKNTNDAAPPPNKEGGGATDMAGLNPNSRVVIAELKTFLAPILERIEKDARTTQDDVKANFRWILSVFGAGFLLLAGLSLTLYSRLDDRVIKADERAISLSNTVIRVDQKLEDLLQRIPPVQTPPRR